MDRKLKVLIVERQKQMIKYYEDFIPWDKFGYEVVSIAFGQDRAMAYFGEYRHDLVITDIQLNDGDGISMIKFIKRLNPSSIIIVITDLEDYENIRNAFVAGASDYLIRLKFKPIHLVEILKRLNKSSNISTIATNWKSEIKNLLGGIRDNQNINEEFLLEKLNREELKFLKNDYRIIFIRMDNVVLVNKGFPSYGYLSDDSFTEFEDLFLLALRNRSDLKRNIEKLSNEFFMGDNNTCVLFTKNHSFLAIVSESNYSKLNDELKNFIKQLEGTIGQRFSMSISKRLSGMETFINGYKQILKFHGSKFYAGDSCILYEEDNRKYQLLDVTSINFHQRILRAFKHNQTTEMASIVEEIMKYFNEQYINPDELFLYFETIFNQMQNVAEHNDMKSIEIFNEFKMGLKRCETSNMMLSELKRIIRVINELFSVQQMSRSKRYVNVINQYIECHMADKIMINEIADNIGLTGIHTSRVYKKETNQELSKYITMRKMETAAKLLENNQLLIKEVANRVGFEDQLYFDKVFKKYFGISPKVYRKVNSNMS